MASINSKNGKQAKIHVKCKELIALAYEDLALIKKESMPLFAYTSAYSDREKQRKLLANQWDRKIGLLKQLASRNKPNDRKTIKMFREAVSEKLGLGKKKIVRKRSTWRSCTMPDKELKDVLLQVKERRYHLNRLVTVCMSQNCMAETKKVHSEVFPLIETMQRALITARSLSGKEKEIRLLVAGIEEINNFLSTKSQLLSNNFNKMTEMWTELARTLHSTASKVVKNKAEVNLVGLQPMPSTSRGHNKTTLRVHDLANSTSSYCDKSSRTPPETLTHMETQLSSSNTDAATPDTWPLDDPRRLHLVCLGYDVDLLIQLGFEKLLEKHYRISLSEDPSCLADKTFKISSPETNEKSSVSLPPEYQFNCSSINMPTCSDSSVHMDTSNQQSVRDINKYLVPEQLNHTHCCNFEQNKLPVYTIL